MAPTAPWALCRPPTPRPGRLSVVDVGKMTVNPGENKRTDGEVMVKSGEMVVKTIDMTLNRGEHWWNDGENWWNMVNAGDNWWNIGEMMVNHRENWWNIVKRSWFNMLTNVGLTINTGEFNQWTMDMVTWIYLKMGPQIVAIPMNIRNKHDDISYSMKFRTSFEWPGLGYNQMTLAIWAWHRNGFVTYICHLLSPRNPLVIISFPLKSGVEIMGSIGGFWVFFSPHYKKWYWIQSYFINQ